jgi:hypothetical protein
MPARRPRTSAVSLELSRKLASLRQHGYDKFRAEYEEQGLSRRHAHYLLKLGRLMRAGQIEPEDVREIGWTKLTNNPENASVLLFAPSGSAIVERCSAGLSGGADHLTLGQIYP